MTAHQVRAPVAAEHDGIERLLEAERKWQQSLDAARAEGERMIAAAKAAAGEAERAFEASIPELLALRRRELDAAVELEARAVLAELTEKTKQYANAPDDFIARIAERIAESAPWICALPDERGES